MIRSSNLFWGGILIIFGGLFLVDSLGIVDINLWGVFWPIMLILFGVWMLMGYVYRGQPIEGEDGNIALEDARSAQINIHHAAGRLTVSSGAGPMDLVSGTFSGGLDARTRADGDHLSATLRVRDRGPQFIFPAFWGPYNRLDWDVNLTDEIPLDLKLKTGASDTVLNLTDLQVNNLRVETGASATEINLPDSVVKTSVVVKAGAASVKVNVPDGVAARIRVTGGLMGASINRERFPKSGGYYQSPDYDSAPYKADIRLEAGAGSLTVH
jgi:hypothetical protein